MADEPQRRTFLALGELARKAGEGQAFLTRFQQEQVLIGSVLRQRQQAAQAEQATFDRETRLQQLAAEQQSRQFSQALALQKQQVDAQHQSEDLAIEERERKVAQDFRIRTLERLEGQVQQRQEQFKVREERLDKGKAVDDLGTQFDKLVGRARKIQQLLDADIASETPFTPDIRLQLEQEKENIAALATSLQIQQQDFEQDLIKEAQRIQLQGPVNKKDAGPALTAALKSAGQSSVLELPRARDGSIDASKIQRGKIYFFPGRGAAMAIGGGRFEPISELEL